jgi:hypothetical protein
MSKTYKFRDSEVKTSHGRRLRDTLNGYDSEDEIAAYYKGITEEEAHREYEERCYADDILTEAYDAYEDQQWFLNEMGDDRVSVPEWRMKGLRPCSDKNCPYDAEAYDQDRPMHHNGLCLNCIDDTRDHEEDY